MMHDIPKLKQYPILSLCKLLNINVVSVSAGAEHYCLSPFRAESTPSFVVNPAKNVWVDFGETAPTGGPLGGTVLDLVMRYYQLDVSAAAELLAALSTRPLAPRPAPPAAELPAAQSLSGRFYDVQLGELAYPPLIAYLQQRGINWPLVSGNRQTMQHLRQVFYRVTDQPREKPYFALAWRTTAGHEVRSPRFQNCLGGKGLTHLPGREPGVMVFEGFLDYLSALTYYRRSAFRCSVLILNSLSQLAAARALLEAEPVVYCFLDNDAAGEKALSQLRIWLPGKIRSYNEVYRGYKDFNDLLTRTPPKKPLPVRRQAPSTRGQRAKWWLWVVFDRPAKQPREKHRDQCCTFYTYSNDANGYASLLALRHRLQDQLVHYRLCERTTGRAFRILAQDSVSRSQAVTAPPKTAVPEPATAPA